MAIHIANAADACRERELSLNLQNLVDGSFEEVKYDTAMALLHRLRHASYKPHAPQIRHALYMALHPPPSAGNPETATLELNALPASPSKLTSRQRVAFAPKIALIEAAQTYLRSLVQINSPEAICRAFPNFGLTGINDLPDIRIPAENSEDDGDFELAKLSKRIKDARSCWDILREDFIPTATERMAVTSGRKNDRKAIDENASDYETSSEVRAPVGEYAWPVLDFLLASFEKDETVTETKLGLRFSPHLLAQIPASRSASGARWDVNQPLDVVFYCFKAPMKASFGTRLLSLLINLTSTVHVDLLMFLNAFNNRLRTTSAEEVQSMFSLLPSTPVSLRFQIALCRLCLADSQKAAGLQPRPQAKAAPRPRAANTKGDSSRNATSSFTSNGPPTTISSLARKPAHISTEEILQIFCAPTTRLRSDPSTLGRRLQLKFLLLSAMAELQNQSKGEDRDPEWTKFAQDEARMTSAIDSAFSLVDGSSADHAFAEDLKMIITLASMRWCR